MRLPEFTGNIGSWASALVGQLNREFDTRDGVTLKKVALFAQRAVSAGIACAGTTQAGATRLVRDFNEIASCAAGVDDAVVAPSAAAGMMITVANTTASAAQLFPASGETIDGLAADTAITLPAGKTVMLFCFAPRAWRSLMGA